jgi:hypothetical protein
VLDQCFFLALKELLVSRDQGLKYGIVSRFSKDGSQWPVASANMIAYGLAGHPPLPAARHNFRDPGQLQPHDGDVASGAKEK